MTVQTKSYEIKRVISTSKCGDKKQIITLGNATKHVQRHGHPKYGLWIDSDKLHYEIKD